MLLGLPATAQQASDKYRSPQISSLTPLPQRAAPTCTEPHIEVVPIRGGLTRIAIETPCRPQQLVIFTYAGAIFIKQLDDAGRTAFTLDCFAGDRETVTIRFEDQTTVIRQPIVEEDMRELTKYTAAAPIAGETPAGIQLARRGKRHHLPWVTECRLSDRPRYG
jgi:hypothetical protein